MTTRSFSLLFAAVAALSLGAPAFAGEGIDCTPIYDATHKAVTAHPDKVLEIVSADVSRTPDCACPIIKAAVSASQADTDLQREIVGVALKAAPEKAPDIRSCIPAGKGPIEIPDTEVWGAPVGGGLYLSSPGSSSSISEETEVVIVTKNPRPRRPRIPPSNPGTGS